MGIKIIAALIILAIGLVAGRLPLTTATRSERHRHFAIGEAFAGGVFLGAALLHLLPDAARGFQTAALNLQYPLAPLICALGFILMLCLEKGCLAFTSSHQSKDFPTIALILAAILSVHSVIAGIAFGLTSRFGDAMMIFAAIAAHKGSAAFALGINLEQSSLHYRQKLLLLCAFALMTPAGIAIASSVHFLLPMHTSNMLEAIFNAFAAGTFIYVASLHCMAEQFGLRMPDQAAKFFSLLLGFAVMAVVAIWL